MTITRTARRIIKAEAERLDMRYRITSNDEVHFHGRLPNTNAMGWWLFAQSTDEAVRRINGDIA